MPKGFSVNQEHDVDWAISNIQKNKKALKGNIKFKRELLTNFWHNSCGKNVYDTPSLASLFSPYNHHSCKVAESPAKDSVIGKHNQQYLYFANSDFWYVFVKRENHNLNGLAQHLLCGVPQTKLKKDHYEFQIGVKVGPYNFFMPSLINERICNWYGHEVYNSWRRMVKDDLRNLTPYISAFNPPKHMYSFACDRSSEKVCESLGLHTKHGVAYWLRKNQSDLKSEVVLETINGTSVSGLDLMSCFGNRDTYMRKTIGNYLEYGPGNLMDFAMNPLASQKFSADDAGIFSPL